MSKLPVYDFIIQRLKEYDPTFELRKGTGVSQFLVKPMQFMLQPFVDAANELTTGQSFRRILLTDSPDSFNEEAVDALAANLFVYRQTGAYAAGVARVYYDKAVPREWAQGGAVFTGSNGMTYSNVAPFAITELQMNQQVEGGLFYCDIPVQATDPGAASDLEAEGLVSIAQDSAVISVTNKLAIVGGKDRETNSQLIARVRKSIGVRDLVTGKGFNATLFEAFATTLTELQPIGFGDDEMMRDIVFNTHIGGKIDGYVKTTLITPGSKVFKGLLIDVTRQTFSSSNVELRNTEWTEIGQTNIDRANGKAPVVQEVKPASSAEYVSTVDMSDAFDVSAPGGQFRYVRIGIDGTFKDVRVSGVIPAQTNRNEIITFINSAFGVNVAFPKDTTLRMKSATEGLQSRLVLDVPTIGVSGLQEVFGLNPSSAPFVFEGDGPITFVESTHYEFTDLTGEIRRVVGPNVIPARSTGVTAVDSLEFIDYTPSIFVGVQINDILSITSGADIGHYRVKGKPNDSTLILDAPLTAAATGVSYYVERTGIKNGEAVYIAYWFNPLSIDIGGKVLLNAQTGLRGIRPGREKATITDTAFLRVRKIQPIDPITNQPLGDPLTGEAGFGYGGFGEGPFGIGSRSQYYMQINSPHERYSAFEDSLIILASGLQGLSFQVDYDYVPEVPQMHDFVRGETERVLDGDILIKHFIPAYVSGTITYSVDATDSTIPTNDELAAQLIAFINQKAAGQALDYSEIYQFIIRATDPFDRYGTVVKPFTLEARIYECDGSITVVTGNEKLEIPKEEPFPKETTRPLSPRIAHWIGDKIVLVRE